MNFQIYVFIGWVELETNDVKNWERSFMELLFSFAVFTRGLIDNMPGSSEKSNILR